MYAARVPLELLAKRVDVVIEPTFLNWYFDVDDIRVDTAVVVAVVDARENPPTDRHLLIARNLCLPGTPLARASRIPRQRLLP